MQMNKRKDRFYIGISLCMAFVVAVFAGLYVLGENRRNTAVEELRAKAAINMRSLTKSEFVVAGPTKSKPRKTPDSVERETPKTHEDTIIVFEALGEKIKESYNDSIWGEIVQRKWYKGWTQEELERGTKYLDENHDLFQEIRRLANFEGLLHVVDYEDRLKRFDPQMQTYANSARWLRFSAFIKARQGDYEGSAADMMAILNLAKKMKEAPTVLAQLIRIQMTGYCYENINENIRGEDLSLDTIRNLVAAVYKTGDRNGFATAMATDGVLSLHAFETVRNHGNLYGIDIEPKFVEDAVMYLYGTPLARPLLNIDEDTYANTMNRMSHALTMPYYEAKPMVDRINEEIANLPPERIVSRRMLPQHDDIPNAADYQAQHEAMIGLMQLGLTIEYYHSQEGVYPDTLEDIAPMLDNPLPTDPYTGQSFVYEPHEDDFTLYSPRSSVVEGGRFIASIFDDQFNIVWRHTKE
jgi:hypothetical protein